MAKSPMVEASYEVLSEVGQELTFNELFEKVVEKLELEKESATKKIAKLYSDITLDKRFVSLEDNKWDLSKRHKFDDKVKDTSDIIVDDEEIDFEEDEELEEDGTDIYDQIDEKKYDEDIKEFEELAKASKDWGETYDKGN